MIQTSHHISPLYLTRGTLWETYELTVENTGDETIPAEAIRFSFSHPEPVKTNMDKAIETSTGSWKPVRDLPPDTKIRFPVNVELESTAEYGERNLTAYIKLRGEVVDKDKQVLIG